jgi:hypothetical protein
MDRNRQAGYMQGYLQKTADTLGELANDATKGLAGLSMHGFNQLGRMLPGQAAAAGRPGQGFEHTVRNKASWMFPGYRDYSQAVEAGPQKGKFEGEAWTKLIPEKYRWMTQGQKPADTYAGHLNSMTYQGLSAPRQQREKSKLLGEAMLKAQQGDYSLLQQLHASSPEMRAVTDQALGSAKKWGGGLAAAAAGVGTLGLMAMLRGRKAPAQFTPEQMEQLKRLQAQSGQQTAPSPVYAYRLSGPAQQMPIAQQGGYPNATQQ